MTDIAGRLGVKSLVGEFRSSLVCTVQTAIDRRKICQNRKSQTSIILALPSPGGQGKYKAYVFSLVGGRVQAVQQESGANSYRKECAPLLTSVVLYSCVLPVPVKSGTHDLLHLAQYQIPFCKISKKRISAPPLIIPQVSCPAASLNSVRYNLLHLAVEQCFQHFTAGYMDEEVQKRQQPNSNFYAATVISIM